jgi:hypothetical protein
MSVALSSAAPRNQASVDRLLRLLMAGILIR